MMSLLALALALAVVAAATSAARGTRIEILRALVILCFGVASINPLIEAVAFGVMPIADVPRSLLTNLVLAVAISAGPVWMLWRGMPEAASVAPPRYTIGRLAAIAGVYVLLYLAAGIAVYPFIKDFYADKTLPSLPMVIGIQCIRGPLYALYALPWLKLTDRHTSPMLALVYSVLGGVALLLVDENPYMPREVRYPHLIEVGVSNFLFGWIVGRILRPKPPQ
jgi:hypothetical protein